jgi:hypothetical protein
MTTLGQRRAEVDLLASAGLLVRGDDDGRWDGDARKWIYSRALAISDSP